MDLSQANIFVTGGAGSLGRAIARKRKEEGWKGKFTVYSRDTFKHERMRKMFPDVNFIQGDILSPELLYNAMVGHDIVIHAAACKVIPTSEYQSIDTFDINVNGSLNVCVQAVRANIQHVLGISTDKACHPANAYGSSKYMMEKLFQEYSRMGFGTQFHLVRYGNVLESTGSVVEAWRKLDGAGEPIRITSSSMTRFWLSPRQAANHAIHALSIRSGVIFVPKMPALSIGKLAKYVIGDDYVSQEIPVRPGEKMHETLVTFEEMTNTGSTQDGDPNDYFLIFPTTETYQNSQMTTPYSSDMARELTPDELMALLND